MVNLQIFSAICWNKVQKMSLDHVIKTRAFFRVANQVTKSLVSFPTEKEAPREGRWRGQSLQPGFQGNENILLNGIVQASPRWAAVAYPGKWCTLGCLHFPISSAAPGTAVFALGYTSGVGWVLLGISITLLASPCFNHLNPKRATVVVLCEMNACNLHWAKKRRCFQAIGSKTMQSPLQMRFIVLQTSWTGWVVNHS